MTKPIIKAFVLCDAISDTPDAPGQKDLGGAGLGIIRASTPFPIKHSFWVYIEISDELTKGNIQLALMRADSGRRLFFQTILVEFLERIHPVKVTVCLDPFILPAPGVYFVELWYNGEWQLDHRLEVL